MMIGINELMNMECLSPIDRHFADFIAGLSDGKDSEIAAGALLASSMTGGGHVCARISDFAGKRASEIFEADGGAYVFPELKAWLRKLRASSVIGRPGDLKPLILDDKGRLYLYRYWAYEHGIAKIIKARSASVRTDIDASLLKSGIMRLFPRAADGEADWQRIAALGAVLRNFYVISGGPGTGKTSAVAKILILIIEQARRKGKGCAVALAAPTGKAAMRLKETVQKNLDDIDCDDDIKMLIPTEAFTIHRLLQPIRNTPYFRYNDKNQLPYDVIVVDESSMVALALMAKLAQAVPESSRLILLGDKDQLSSVEAGAVLGDICDTGQEHAYTNKYAGMIKEITGDVIPGTAGEPEIADSIVILRRSYRFGSDSGIGALSYAIRDGCAKEALRILGEGRYPDVRFIPSKHERPVAERALDGYAEYLAEKDPLESFIKFNRFAVLCAVREGPYGVVHANALIESMLHGRGIISRGGKWYEKQPVMVARNDYTLGLFNGDIGIICADPGGHELRAGFLASDGSIRLLSPGLLPEHETVYAMTVHKSQGSEFDHVLLIIPDRHSLMITRELLYTAVTRARLSIEIWADEAVLEEAIKTPVQRKSGLKDALWE